MPKIYPPEVREKAKSLYLDGMTGKILAEHLDVSMPIIRKWAQAEDWDGLRKQAAEKERIYREKRLQLCILAIDTALEAKTPEYMNAACHVDRTFRRQESALDEPSVFMNAIEFFLKELKQRAPEALRIIGPQVSAICNKWKEEYKNATTT